MLIFIIIVLIIGILFLTYKYLALKRDVSQLTIQLQQLSQDISSNQRLRTTTQFHEMQQLTKALNHMCVEYKQQRIQFRKKELMLNQEITNISHDLRTPLTAIKGYSELFTDDIEVTEQRRYLNIIKNKTTTLIETVNLFHEITKLKSLDYELKVEPVSLNTEIEQVFLSYYAQFTKQQLEVRFNLQRVSNVKLDLAATRRILTNLVQNILRYGKSFVDICIYEQEDFVVVKLANDTDEALTDENIQDIFKRTYTLDKSRHQGRTGIGLYIIAQLVEKQGGNVSANIKNDLFTITMKFHKG